MKTTKFNPFDYIVDDQEVKLFLDDCLADDDPQTFINALSHLIDKKGVKEVAKITGLNRESMYKTINGQTKPSWDTVYRIMQALNVSMTVNVGEKVLQPT